jgi:hypothetical protein
MKMVEGNIQNYQMRHVMKRTYSTKPPKTTEIKSLAVCFNFKYHFNKHQ